MTDTAKHTPGPWSLGTLSERPNLIEANDPLLRGNLNLVMVAEVFLIGENKQHEANARLIAAAPDLLEAMRELLDANSYYFPTGNPWGDKARAAIAKAEGGAA